MKAGIHPDYHEVKHCHDRRTTFKTRSCMGKPGETLRLDLDPKSLPAWTACSASWNRWARWPSSTGSSGGIRA